jgi:hypothetical protein
VVMPASRHCSPPSRTRAAELRHGKAEPSR